MSDALATTLGIAAPLDRPSDRAESRKPRNTFPAAGVMQAVARNPPDPRDRMYRHARRALATTLLFATVLPAQEPQQSDARQADAQHASELRAASSAAWRAKDFRTASDKLKQADAIYAQLGDSHIGDRAVCCRAIVHNEVAVGEIETAFEWFERLLQLAAKHDSAARQLDDAYGGIAGAANNAQGLESQHRILERVRRMVQAQRQPKLASQCLHDMAGHSAAAGDLPGMQTLYQRAIRERQQIGDTVGLGWSLNNAAYENIRAGRIHEAMKPLAKLFDAQCGGDMTTQQRAVAINLASMHVATADDRPRRKVVDWWWKRAKTAARSDTPFVFPPDRALRHALELDLLVQPKKARATVQRGAKIVRDANWPDDVKRDAYLRLAEVALEANDTELAGDLCDRVEVPDGPCRRHLAARRATLDAIVEAKRGDAEAFDEKARAAVDAMREVGHRSALQATFDALLATRVRGSKEFEQLQREAETLRRTGRPGGFGGSAMSQNVGTLPADSNDHTVVFELSWDEDAEKIVVTDRIGGSSKQLEVAWQPRNVTFNGLGLGLLGGYVRVDSMRYGGASGASGLPGMATLDEFGNYVPISTAGVWQVTRNGALKFEPRR